MPFKGGGGGWGEPPPRKFSKNEAKSCILSEKKGGSGRPGTHTGHAPTEIMKGVCDLTATEKLVECIARTGPSEGNQHWCGYEGGGVVPSPEKFR